METRQSGSALSAASTAPIEVAHIAGRSRHYPGETVLFYTRLSVREAQPGATLRISIPAGLRLEGHSVTPELPDTALHTEDRHGIQTLIWSVSSQLEPGMHLARCERSLQMSFTILILQTNRINRSDAARM